MKNGILKRSVALGIISVLSLVSLAACSSQKDGKNVTTRVAFFPNITHSQALVGKAEGHFQKAFGEENKIEWKEFNAGPAEIEAMFAGEIDIGYIGPGPAINGYTKSNGDLQILAGATDAGAIFVSRKDLVIKDLNELSGKRVAVPQFGNTQDLSLRDLLNQNGLKDTTKGGSVEIRQAENPDIKTLLDQGEVDAAFVPEPWGSRLIKEVGANIILDYDQVFMGGKYTTAVVIARKEFINKHPDLVEKFIRTHVELTEYINENPDKAKKIVNEQINELTKKPLADDVLDAAFNRLTVTYDPEKASVEEFARLSFETGFLKERPDLKSIFNLDALNKVLKEKGLNEIK